MVQTLFHFMSAFMLFTEFHIFAGAQGGIGVSYPRNADDLPPARKAINLCKSKNIKRIHLFDPNHDALHALKNTGIQVILGVSNYDILSIAYNPKFAKVWVRRNVGWYAPYINFRCITVGDELAITNSSLRDNLLPAMNSLQQTLDFFNLYIPVSIGLPSSIFPTSFPPSAGHFEPDMAQFILPIVDFLQMNRYPLLYPVYSYYSYLSDISYSNTTLDFALLNTTEVSMRDEKLNYTNILDALVDTAYSALEKAGGNDIEIIVTETGWPACKGTDIATVVNAQTYNNNLIKRLSANVGTPKRSKRVLECYIFSLFVQDFYHGKDCYGLFYPNMTQAYPLDFWVLVVKESLIEESVTDVAYNEKDTRFLVHRNPGRPITPKLWKNIQNTQNFSNLMFAICEGTPIATVANAQTCYLVKRLKNNVETAKRPGRGVESFQKREELLWVVLPEHDTGLPP